MRSIHLNHPKYPEATLEGYLLDCELKLGQETARPAILVCPGGGYVFCSPTEAEPVALRYAAQGYHALILRYSTGHDAIGFRPLEEVSWAIGLLREHAEEWHIDPDKIAICGFSAGGHLALASGLLAEQKPNAMILTYPVAQLVNSSTNNFMLRLLTGRDTITDADAEKFSLLQYLTEDAPPVFLSATAEDVLTPRGVLAIANAYSERNLPYELHVFQYGPHGYSLADATSADGSDQVLDEAFAHWHELSVLWLQKTFGKPQFVHARPSRFLKHLQALGFEKPDLNVGE